MSTTIALTCGICGAGQEMPHLPNCSYRGSQLEPVLTPASDVMLPVHAHVRPTWDDYFLDLARAVATRATCPRAHIGCVLVAQGSQAVVATGFNGAESGEPHCDDVGCRMLADHCVTAIHAEVNAALQYRARTDPMVVGAEALTAYVLGPRPVCSHCARELATVGVTRVEWRAS